MSLPQFPQTDPPLTREDVINQIIASIAMEELGLSHIINAEGEKIQYALGTIEGVTGPAQPLTVQDLMTLNSSIHKTLDGTMQNQIFLRDKLKAALSASVMQGPTGPTGPTAPFLSVYMEALADAQTVAANSTIRFDAGSIDTAGNAITISGDGSLFTINLPGLYHVEWTLNLAAVGTAPAVAGILENGQPSSGASSSTAGNFSSGTLITVNQVPFTLSLHNFAEEMQLEIHPRYQDSAGSIRILRFADGPAA